MYLRVRPQDIYLFIFGTCLYHSHNLLRRDGSINLTPGTLNGKICLFISAFFMICVNMLSQALSGSEIKVFNFEGAALGKPSF